MKKIFLIMIAICSMVAVNVFAGATGQPMYIVNPTNEVLVTGVKNVTVAGTAVALGTAKNVREILIQAKRTNTGRIYIGPSTVLTNDTNGIYLDKGDSFRLFHTDMTQIYINSTVNGEGVTYLAW